MGDHHLDEKAIFLAAIEIGAADERNAYLDAACANDPKLRAEVELLLCEHDRAQSLLDAPDIAAPTIDMPPIAERPGTMVGRYKLLQEIGEGGMGVVYMAEQREPVSRDVALKIIKPGMDTKEVVARFDAERQALAVMDHPNIAHVHDAGATESGRPYFVMELVQGVPITEFCDEHNLSIRERLELFVSVCQAVQHAHQKGIIHRDIKPSNVLVALTDDVPVPKVIDFGVAKVTEARLTDNTSVTGIGQLLGTPMYMSPEQAGRSGQDVDTRTDIYSLGVLLYEILTGLPPFDKERFRQASYEEISAIIREQEAPKPSIRITTVGEAATTISAHRHASPAQLRRTLRGDLDRIVMKTLEKDRELRFATARDLAEDVRRFLDGEPIHARPPSLLDGAIKWSRRHKPLVWSTAAVLLMAILVLAVSSVLLTKKQRELVVERNKATEQWRRAEQAATSVAEINRFLTEDLLGNADPDRNPVGDQVTLLEVLDEAAQKVDAALSGRPEIKAELHRTIGQTYSRLGEFPKSAAHYRAAFDLLKNRAGPTSPETLGVAIQLGSALKEMGDWDNAERLLRNTLESSRRTLGIEHATFRGALVQLYELMQLRDRDDAAEEILGLLRQHLESRQRTLGKDHPETLTSLHNLAEMLWHSGSGAEAEPLFRQVVEARRRVLGNDHRDTLESATDLGLVMMSQGKLAEAEAAMRGNLEAKRRLFGPKNLSTVEEANNLAAALAYQGKLDEAELLFQECVEACRDILGVDHPQTLENVNNLTWVLLMRNELEDAEKLLRDNWTAVRRKRGPQHVRAIVTGTWLGHLLLHQGEYRQAEQIGRQNLTAARESLGPKHTARGEAMIVLSSALYAQRRDAEAGEVAFADLSALFAMKESAAFCEHLALTFFLDHADLDQAEEWDRNALMVKRRPASNEYPISLATTLAWLGRVLIANNKTEEAEALLRECLAIRQRALPEGHGLVAETESLLGDCLARQGKCADAEPMLTQSYDAIAASEQFDPNQKIEAMERIVSLYDRWGKPDKSQQWGEQLEGYFREILASQQESLPADHRSILETESRLGDCLAAMDRFEEAEPLLLDSYAAFSRRYAEGYKPGRARFLRESSDRIVRFYERRGESEVATAWRALSRIESDADAPEPARHAVTYWELLCQQHPDELNYLANLGVSYCCLAAATSGTGKLDEAASWYVNAEEVFLHVLRSSPEDRRASEYLGRCYSKRSDVFKKLGHFAECFADYEQALQIRTDDHDLLGRAAWAMANCADSGQRKPRRALSLASKAVRLDPTSTFLWRVAGAAQYRMGQWPDAVTSLAKAVELSGSEGGPHECLLLAMTHWQLGQSQEAEQWYDKGATWIEEREPNDGLMRLRAEAAALLGIAEESITQDARPASDGHEIPAPEGSAGRTDESEDP